MTEDEIGTVQQNGFAIIPGVIGCGETMALAAAIENADMHRSRAGIRHLLGNPAVAALAQDSRLLGMAQQILGHGAFPFRATLFDKSPDANWLITWHQDTALPLREKHETQGWGPWSMKEGLTYAHAPASALEQIIALRLHLDDSNLMNGPLRVLPGTHIDGVLNDDTVLQLGKDRSAMDCLVPAGGVLAMRPLLVHASSKSQVAAPRRVLHIEYAATPYIADGLQLAVA